METKVSDFKSIILKIASPDRITSWSKGEITKAETINYRTQRPEKDGLFDERIFGPEKDYECACGKYRRIRYKGIVCDKCGVEVTRSIVRRERMGHITLAAPVAHIWFLRSIPSRVGLLLGISLADLEKVIYFAGYIITKVDDDAKKKVLSDLEKEYKTKSKSQTTKKDALLLKDVYEKTKSELDGIRVKKILSEVEYHELSLKYGDIFEAGIGAEAIYKIIKQLDLDVIEKEISDAGESDAQNRKKAMGRLRLVRSLKRAGIRPEWMFLTVIPVTPPALRPMVALDGGRHATSDVNDLYRRVINRNNRLKRLIDLSAPEVIVRNEKRILQEAVDALIDNSMRRGGASAVSQSQRRPLKSLADALKGKHGRFRQNLLGKRVDYSGRSVIVVGPELRLDQCGLPKHMALELFRPFVIAEILKRDLAHNIRGANRLIDEATPGVWSSLEDVIKDKYVLLNRAPTLHRLGIQAFKPILIEGNAIQVHPLVCPAYNADFDGDQMAVHVPLTAEAQKEAAEIILSTKNLTKPGTGNPIVNPTQDMILGIFWMTRQRDGVKGEGMVFSSPNEAILAYEFGHLNLRAEIKVGLTDTPKYQTDENKKTGYIKTTVGRLLFNSILPGDFEFVNNEVKKKDLGNIVARLVDQYGRDEVPKILDKIKNFGFKYSTISGASWGIDDLRIPSEKQQIIDEARQEVDKISEQFNEGLLNDRERYRAVIEIWAKMKQRVDELVPGALDQFGPVFTMVSSSARGSWGQVSQMSGMRGALVNPSGRIIELPVFSNYKEGLKVLEYFISSHGARKGTADTALKTAEAGYLTRRLVDVSQDVMVVEKDCKSSEGLLIKRAEIEDYGKSLSERIFGRVLAEDVKNDNKTLFKKGHLLSLKDAEIIESAGVNEVLIRSPLSCKTFRGVCQMCYGYDLGMNELVEIGQAVGIVAAQSVGEPGTQLTMRTFHSGGVAAEGDITQGLPRVGELFEARNPSVPAVLADVSGVVSEIKESENNSKVVKILLDNESKKTQDDEAKEYLVPFSRSLMVEVGTEVKRGDRISDGPVNTKELFELSGGSEAQLYIINEVSRIYTQQGASINDKHLEVVVGQMFSKAKVTESGDTILSIGEVTDKSEIDEQNKIAKENGGKPAKYSPVLLGITRASLSSSSWLAAASFQETNRILIMASTEGKEDKLRGLKENVIIGRIIPAGTGVDKEYKRIDPSKTHAKEI